VAEQQPARPDQEDQADQEDQGEHHRETPEEFVNEAEVAAWQTVEEFKDLPHDAKRLAEKEWAKLKHLGHHEEHPEGSGQ
jgi:hypothetical protein